MHPHEIVRHCRRKANLSQADLAKVLGKRQSAVCNYEKRPGLERSVEPSVSTLEICCLLAGYRLDLLLVDSRGAATQG
ncbi:MAG: helix-turn-helix transcriptional regulator [Lentisphaeria bacterium]|nr:helix-turn-helix transcriptional regulator [Lentisphaeria bacterium]